MRSGITSLLLQIYSLRIFFRGATAPSGPGPPHCRGFTITIRHITLGKTPLDLWSGLRKQHTTLTRDRHPCPRRNSNPQSQQASGRRPTPQTARPLASTGEKWASSIRFRQEIITPTDHTVAVVTSDAYHSAPTSRFQFCRRYKRQNITLIILHLISSPSTFLVLSIGPKYIAPSFTVDLMDQVRYGESIDSVRAWGHGDCWVLFVPCELRWGLGLTEQDSPSLCVWLCKFDASAGVIGTA
jgi:hypothetical protein